MELYNLVTYTGQIKNGKRYPTEESKKEIKRILSILPSGFILNTELQFIEDSTNDYMSEPMPKDVLDRYVATYLKLLINQIAHPNSVKVSLSRYSDVLFGQICMGNANISADDKDSSQISRVGLARILSYDFAKDLVNANVNTKQYRISMSIEHQDEEYFGAENSESATIFLNPDFNNIESVLNMIGTIFHEVQHAAINSNKDCVVYKGSLEYVANKLHELARYMPQIRLSDDLVYNNSPHEMSANYVGGTGLYNFKKRHRLSGLAREINDLDLQSYEMLMDDFKLFNIDGDNDYLSVSDGQNIDINSAFNRLIEHHPELCRPESYFSIEYDEHGKRRSLSDVLYDMSKLDLSDENIGKREVLGYIITHGVIEDDVPSKALEALYEYKSTTRMNDREVQAAIQVSLLDIVKRMEKEFLEEDAEALREKSSIASTGFLSPGNPKSNSHLSRVSAVIDKILERCNAESEEVANGERENLSPFVKAVMSSAPGNERALNSNRVKKVGETLMDYQDNLKRRARFDVYGRNQNGYGISIDNVAQMVFGPIKKRFYRNSEYPDK